MRENANQNNFEYAHFSRIFTLYKKLPWIFSFAFSKVFRITITYDYVEDIDY